MLTKKELCQLIIKNFSVREKIPIVSDSDIRKSSCLAVAMEYLNLIQLSELKQYAKSRGGILYCGVSDDNEPVTLSLRELLSLLPD